MYLRLFPVGALLTLPCLQELLIIPLDYNRTRPCRTAWKPTNPKKTIQKAKPNVNDLPILVTACFATRLAPGHPLLTGSFRHTGSPCYHTTRTHFTSP